MRKFLLLFGLFCFSSLGVSAKNLDAIKNEKGDDQFPLSYCYELRVQKEILNNWLPAGPTSLIILNKYTTEAGSLVWSDEVNATYNNDLTFDFNTGTGILYTIQTYPEIVSLDKCMLIINP